MARTHPEGWRLLPAEVIDRKKMGFGIPLEHWFRHSLRPMVNDLLLDRTAREELVMNWLVHARRP